MSRQLLYRNVRAGELLDIFLLSAAASLLIVRFYLHLTGYPQIGGGGLHISHMLFGGVFMLASMTMMLAFIGVRSQRIAALLGGAGFGIFIDEIGKFITSDNNYFFKPSVGLIYAIFVVLYLSFSFLSRRQRLTSREYQLNALIQFEEAILLNMDPYEKRQAQALLDKANQRSHITVQLQAMLAKVSTVTSGQPTRLRRVLSAIDRRYTSFWRARESHRLVRAFFIAESGIFVLAIFINVYRNLDDIGSLLRGDVTYGSALLIGQLISSLIAAGYVAYGAFLLTASRAQAFEQFRRATLVNLFLTEFFVFSRIEFEALPGFTFNVVVLLFVSYVLRQERRLT